MVAVAKRLLIGAVLAFAGSVLLGFGVRAGLDTYYLTGGVDGGVTVDGTPSEEGAVACGSLLAPAHDPDPSGCAALRDQAQVPAAVLAFLGLCALTIGVVVIVMGRPRPAAPATHNPWELGSTAT